MKTRKTTAWKIDGTIDLTAICVRADWHLATAIDGLMAAGLPREDAEAFAGFSFQEFAELNGGRADGRSEDHITDSQWDRLTVGK